MHKYFKVSEKYKNENDNTLIKDAMEKQSMFFNEYQENIRTALYMRTFLYADQGQWSAYELSDRRLRGKVSQQINVVEPVCRTLIAENAAADTEAIITSDDVNAPTEIVKLKADLHEQICYESTSSKIFNKCFEDMIDCGYGAFELVSKPKNDTSFENVLRYQGVEDVLYCYFDTSAKHVNKIDGDFAGYFFAMSKEDAEIVFEEENIQSVGFPGIFNQDYIFAQRKDLVVLNKHYRKIHGSISMVKLDDGAEMPEAIYKEVKKEILVNYAKLESKYAELLLQTKQKAIERGLSEEAVQLILSELPAPHEPDIPSISKRKKCHKFYYEMLIFSRNKILKREVLPVEKIPLFYVGAYDKRVRGRTVTQPFAANAVAPQRLVNYIVSEQIDNIGRSFGARVVALDEAISGKEANYARPNVSSLLTFSKDMQQNIVKPEFIYSSGVDQGLNSVFSEHMQNIKSVLGRYNDNMGEESNAYGYQAILRRQMNGDITASIYPENLNYAKAEAAKLELEWMPFVYDTERTVLVRSKNGESRFVTINRPTGDQDEMGNLILANDLRIGTFSVQVFGGMSFMTQRLAGMQYLNQLMENDETLKHDLLDIYIGLSPFAFKNQVIKRLEVTEYINPAVMAEENGQPPPKQKPNPVEILAKLQVIEKIKTMQYQERKSKLEMANQLIELKQNKEKYEDEIAQKELELIGSTADAVSKIADASAKAQTDEINDAQKLVDELLEKELSIINELTNGANL